MSIKKKLYLNFGLILGIVVVLCLMNLLAVWREHSGHDAMLKSLRLAQDYAGVNFSVMQNQLYLRSYLLSGKPDDLARFRQGYSDLDEKIRAAEEESGSDLQRQALAKLREVEAGWMESYATPLIAKRNAMENGSVTAKDWQVYYRDQDADKWILASNTQMEAADKANRDDLELSRSSDDRASNFTMAVTIFGLMLVVGLGVVIAYRTSDSITRPLERLMAVAGQIGESGDLGHEIDVERSDEVGALARSFSRMVSYLKEMAAISEAITEGDLSHEVEPRSARDTLGRAFARMTEGLAALVRSVRDSAAQVASGSGQVANASEESAKMSVQSAAAIDEVTSTMHEMSINVQNMVKNTQMQAASVNETSGSIDEMVASIQRVADTCKVLLEISNRSRQEVQNGIVSMEKATDGLSRINTSIQSSSEIIGVLGSRTDDIGKIIEVIDDLAEQTNLLALNAAIEAARAGEHGLGFAVVADEVRKLAEKSAQSTKEISELIQSIQREARKAVENMDKSTGLVNEGLALGTDLGGALRKISNVVTEVYKFAQEIGAATNEQSHGSTQIARATTRLNEITHETSSSVEEQASGTQAVVKAMERMRELVQQSTSGSTELAASAEQMSKMSRSLLEVMDRFKLDPAEVRSEPPHPRRAVAATAGGSRW
jgi:methyl-accepting chemotaxis protein